MKTACALVMGLGLIFSASAAYASPDGSDPSVIINKTSLANSGGGSDPDFSTNSIENPLVITLDDSGLSPSISFTFDPSANDPQTLSELFVQLDNSLPLEQFFCRSDIFSGPCGSFNTGVSDAVGLIFTDGTITAGEQFYAQVPEPQMWMLLVVSMLGLLMFGLRYWKPTRSEL